MLHDTPTPRSVRAAVLLGALSIGASFLGPAGCATPSRASGERVAVTDADQSAADQAFTREVFDDQVKAGVLRQRALFEHHFEVDAAGLNSLGRRDVAILADAMSSAGGRISVQRGSAGKDLYAARLASVRAALASAGVPAKRVKLDGAPAGGVGASTSQAILIHAQMNDSLQIETGEVLSSGPGMGTAGGVQ